jgi:hypothetical protein
MRSSKQIKLTREEPLWDSDDVEYSTKAIVCVGSKDAEEEQANDL